MAGRFEATVVIERPIEDVFAFLADGENDPKFSPRVLEIAKTSDGPPGVDLCGYREPDPLAGPIVHNVPFHEFRPPPSPVRVVYPFELTNTFRNTRAARRGNLNHRGLASPCPVVFEGRRGGGRMRSLRWAENDRVAARSA